MAIPREAKLLIYVNGIYLFYLLYAIIQEDITKKVFEGGERFTFMTFMLSIQCGVGALVALLTDLLIYRSPPAKTPQSKFFLIALLYLTAMWASSSALIYVSYPTQVLAKSCKPIPVMLVGYLFMGKKYRWLEWFFVLLIVAGISLFLYRDSAPTKNVDEFQELLGNALLLLSLACDGFTSPLQERIFAGSRPSPIQMMMMNNFYAALISGVVAFGLTNQAVDAIDFCQRHPEVYSSLALVSILAAFGQICIFFLVSDFGALTTSIATTVRKFFTILGSIVFYGHFLSSRQWGGVALVFLGLVLNSSWKYLAPAKKPAKSE